MGNKNGKLTGNDYNDKIKCDILEGGKLMPSGKYNKTIYFYDDFMHFKGINTSYLVLNYKDILSWQMNFLIDLIQFVIYIDKQKYTIKLQFADIHVFNDIFMKHINNKVDDIDFAKKLREKKHGKDKKKKKKFKININYKGNNNFIE